MESRNDAVPVTLSAVRLEDLPSGWWHAGRALAPAGATIHGSAGVLVRFAVSDGQQIVGHRGALVSVMLFEDTQTGYVRYHSMAGRSVLVRCPFGTTLRLEPLDLGPGEWPEFTGRVCERCPRASLDPIGAPILPPVNGGQFLFPPCRMWARPLPAIR